MNSKKLSLKRMGVINITPNSFSDGGELLSPQKILTKIDSFGPIDAVDIGAESTAPMNSAISWREEWERWQLVLPLLKNINCAISADTYHPETIFELVKFWKDKGLSQKLIWNDVSGKIDEAVKEFLKKGHEYVFSHNNAPSRDLSGKHMDYVEASLDLESLADYFRLHKHQNIIFDPCLGFSKSYEQNWMICDRFAELQKMVGHQRWLLGLSRKSFLRKKYDTQERNKLDQLHVIEVKRILEHAVGEVWIRSHCLDLIDG